MAHPRQGRRRYYDLFSRFYDAFIRMHSRRDEDDTREFLVDAAFLGNKPAPRILDVCCGTGSVTLAFDRRYPGSMTVGYDFSRGMLHKAMEKNVTGRVRFVEGDAAFPLQYSNFPHRRAPSSGGRDIFHDLTGISLHVFMMYTVYISSSLQTNPNNRQRSSNL